MLDIYHSLTLSEDGDGGEIRSELDTRRLLKNPFRITSEGIKVSNMYNYEIAYLKNSENAKAAASIT